MTRELLRLEYVNIFSGSAHILRDFRLRLVEGEVMGILSVEEKEARAIAQLLSGSASLGGGELYLRGRKVDRADAIDPELVGMTVVRQGAPVVPFLSVADNVVLFSHTRPRLGIVKDREIRARAQSRLETVGLGDMAQRQAHELSALERCLLLIAKALAAGHRIVVFANASGDLSEFERRRFWATLRELASSGMSFAVLGHDAEDLRHGATRIVTVREGRVAVSIPRAGPLGPFPGARYTSRFESPPAAEPSGSPIVLTWDSCPGGGEGLKFDMRGGEILAFLDRTSHAGRAIFETLDGTRTLSGEIKVMGKKLDPMRAGAARQAGIALVPEDPRALLVDGFDAIETLCLAARARTARATGLVNSRVERYVGKSYAQILELPIAAMRRPSFELPPDRRLRLALESLAFSRPLAAFFLKPGAYLDEDSRRRLVALMEELAAQGCAVAMLEPSAALAGKVSHRVLVASSDRIVAELRPEDGRIDIRDFVAP
jgi:ABC-type sugar transport system ATPase subunit